jgi:hypothetical protein
VDGNFHFNLIKATAIIYMNEEFVNILPCLTSIFGSSPGLLGGFEDGLFG